MMRPLAPLRISALTLVGLLVALPSTLPAAQAIPPPVVDLAGAAGRQAGAGVSRCGKATFAPGPSRSPIRM